MTPEPQVLPFGTTTAFTIDVPIQNTIYRFSYKWNNRFLYWECGIYSTDNIPLVEGIKVVHGYDLIGQYVDKGLPIGKIIPVRVDGRTQRIEYGEIESGAVVICFFDESDL